MFLYPMPKKGDTFHEEVLLRESISILKVPRSREGLTHCYLDHDCAVNAAISRTIGVEGHQTILAGAAYGID